MTRFGGWLFRHRTSIPLPLAVIVLVLPVRQTALAAQLIPYGLALIAAGEAIRFWGVRHIGAISRTRSERLGPLVDTGPFALVRNPLYIGNIALWAGFALVGRNAWLAPLFVVILGIEYHAIVRWEEALLTSRLGAVYVDYMQRVPRWMPELRHKGREGHKGSDLPKFSGRETVHSERGTLIAIAVGLLLLALKAYGWRLMA